MRTNHSRVSPEEGPNAGEGGGGGGAALARASSLVRSTVKPESLSNTERFLRRHGKQGAEEIQTTASAIAQALKERQSRSMYVLHPEKNKYLNWWDGVTTCALIYTATLTPFETAFISPAVGESAWSEPWFIANRVLDVVFFADLIVQFFVAYQTGDAYGGRTWVVDRALVQRHYLRSWFAVDAFTVFLPGSVDLYLASLGNASEQGKSIGTNPVLLAERASLLRVLRVIRLVKLVRLLRASRVIERQAAKITIGYGTQTIIKCTSMLLCLAHWYACIIALQTTLQNDLSQSWVSNYGFCLHGGKEEEATQSFLDDVDDGIDDGSLDAYGDSATASSSSVALPGCDALSIGRWYLATFTWATQLITATGGNDFYPSGSTSDGETVVVMILNVLSAFLWTFVLAAFCDVATNSDPALTTFRQRLDGLNKFIRVHGLPTELARRLRRFMHQQKGVQLREDAKLALPHLSPALQVEVLLLVNRHWMDTVWFMPGLEGPVKVKLAMAMEPKVLAPGEVAPNRHLYLITRGKIIFGGRVLSCGMVWGDDIILSNATYALPTLARALTYVDVNALSRESLVGIISAYPISAKSLRRHTIFLALRRSVVRAAGEVKVSVSKSGQIGVAGDFVSRMHDAAANALSEEQKHSMEVALSLASSDTGGGGDSGGVNFSSPAGMATSNGMSSELAEALAAIREDLRLLREQVKSEVGELRSEINAKLTNSA